MPVTVAVHDGLTGAVYPGSNQIGRNFCLSESDSADVIVARIKTVMTSSED